MHLRSGPEGDPSGGTRGADPLDPRCRRQGFTVGAGFLISDDHFDRLDDGASWLAPRPAFTGAEPVRGDLVYPDAGGGRLQVLALTLTLAPK